MADILTLNDSARGIDEDVADSFRTSTVDILFRVNDTFHLKCLEKNCTINVKAMFYPVSYALFTFFPTWLLLGHQLMVKILDYLLIELIRKLQSR